MTSKTVGEIAGDLRKLLDEAGDQTWMVSGSDHPAQRLLIEARKALPILLSALESQTEEDGTHAPAVMPEGEGALLACPFCGDGMEIVNGGDANPRLVQHPMNPLDGKHCIISHLHFPIAYLELWNRRAALNRTTKEPS